MATKLINQDTIPFEVEARLLQELGERLVASPDVALLELIKNQFVAFHQDDRFEDILIYKL